MNMPIMFDEVLPSKGIDAAHVIVCGNEKGGSGKTTTSMHLVVFLLKAGFRVASIDLDSRQQSLSRYIQNRKNWSSSNDINLEMPNHFRMKPDTADSKRQAQNKDYSAFYEAIREVEKGHDFIVIDTPGSDSYLMRLAHSMADTLITPMNDSFVDFDLLGKVDPNSLDIVDISQYALMVRQARRARRQADNGLLDWVVLRNRISPLASHNQQNLIKCVNGLSSRLGFRVADGIGERVIYRELFPKGLTALDDPKYFGLSHSSSSYIKAREEVDRLVSILRLPIDELGLKRASARKLWLSQSYNDVDVPDIFSD